MADHEFRVANDHAASVGRERPDQVLDHFGRAILPAADYPYDLAVFAMLLDRLGVTRRYPDSGDELIHVINVAPYPIETRVWRTEQSITPQPVTIGSGPALLLDPTMDGVSKRRHRSRRT